MSYLTFAAAFVAMVAVDICWAKYTMYLAEKRAHLSSAWSAGIVACGAITTLAMVENHYAIIANIAGAYVGTFIAVKTQK